MLASLAFTSFLMGLAGGPHCIAMCGAACAGIGQTAGARSTSAMGLFQVGRIIGYATLGGVAAASLQGIGWLTTQSAAIRPVWTLFHVAAIALGLLLLLQARQPVWLEHGARRVWSAVRGFQQRRGRSAPLTIGALWAFMPCGLLYSALMVAALAGSIVGGVVTMALFALGTSVSLMLGPWLLLRLPNSLRGEWGMRLAGLALMAASGWALWMGLAHDQAPWCITPA